MGRWPFDPGSERYVNLATYRRDGREVRTPVWLAGDGSRFYLFSASRAGKVKRIRANPRARLAACDVRGSLKSGWLEARARVVEDPALVEGAYAALRSKYGLVMKVVDVLSKLSGRYEKRAIIELEVIASG
ncbi:MAG: PPOX class F420-dependent oxidoreductase [Gammaproteobacteria bacterium]|nr:PPOX class F420-dependent oxidoreductase [Gammaproteobacteria bacterium]NIN39640.1 PPOX class F420-dependent oxidoreductase [Gammaproteobacteria bacterium]NIO25197.1 PPOX class F420-dependent oxidoreductase [Gammaproteobacteria bacterium]NIO65826.1 PPOX class F420-dependent oxidoreductase [Gammaproteobacteria bacterium]NIP45735.1 PPOX class F420-dependent oxidoreductase [Gammaproteobacteria bacterium]